MEYNIVIDRPLVGIGVLQGERTMHFNAAGAFKVQDLDGNVLGTGESGRRYAVTIVNSTACESRPAIRLGIRFDKSEADALQNRWQQFGLNTEAIRVGENVRVGRNDTWDNREFWVLGVGFGSAVEADQMRRELPDFGSYQVVSIPRTPAGGKLTWNDVESANGLRLVPGEPKPVNFTLENVRVGIGFHWDRRESQDYEGELAFHIDREGLITAVNVLDVEQYLASVNSSEMVPECSLEFLKAQTIGARSTVLATAGKHHFGDPFDLCADDHCQCFHGAGVIAEKSLQAAQESLGEVLVHDGRVCDARYAKVCAGIGESFANVWDDRHIPYLDRFYDNRNGGSWQPVDDEDVIQSFISSSPDVYCNPAVHPVPPHLDYAHAYFRWQETYDSEELGAIVAGKLGRDLGPIREIIPVKRGYSGRLIYVRVVGDLAEATLGKELEIRRILSKSHLYSSCFYVKKDVDEKDRTTRLTLHGGGWGHGVGICQVGAAVMGEQGASCEEILKHYYHASEIVKIF